MPKDVGANPLGPAQLEQQLSPSVRAVGAAVADPEAWERLSAYARELAAWNKRINLTAARSPAEIVRQMEECLPLLPHLPGDAGLKVIDVGAGGGLPGLVLAAFRPELSWVLIEPIHKKHAFLRAAVRAMRVSAECRAVRDEAVEAHTFAVALTRATWPMDEWLVRGARLVQAGGLVLGLEGKEKRPLPDGAGRVSYRLGGRERVAVVLGC